MFPNKVPGYFDLSYGKLRDTLKVKNIKSETFINNADSRSQRKFKRSSTIIGAELHLVKCKNLTFDSLTFELVKEKNLEYFTGARDCVRIERCKDILFLNCTFKKSIDELVSVVSSKRVTFENCTFTDPIWVAKKRSGDWVHPDKTSHGYGVLIRGSYDVKFKDCVFNGIEKRAPSVSPDGKYDCLVTIKDCFIMNCKECVKINDGSDKKDIELIVIDNSFINCEIPFEFEKIRGKRTIQTFNNIVDGVRIKDKLVDD